MLTAGHNVTPKLGCCIYSQWQSTALQLEANVHASSDALYWAKLKLEQGSLSSSSTLASCLNQATGLHPLASASGLYLVEVLAVDPELHWFLCHLL